MKTSVLLFAAALAPLALGGVLHQNYLEGALVAPEVQEEEPKFYEGSKRTKIRYGPFKLMDVNHKGAMFAIEGETGVLTTAKAKMKKPCSECMVTWMRAGLEYTDGSDANIGNGAWLHHMVLLSIGPGKKDLTCPIPGERWFSSGNERLPIAMTDLSGEKLKSGYHVKPTDVNSMEIELMNMNEKPITVYLTLTYEYVPGPPKEGWMRTRAVWFDVTGCFKASEQVPPKTPQFTLRSSGWKSSLEGQLLSIGGHLHDGGVDVQSFHNGEKLCDSVAAYGESPAYIQRSPAREAGMKHISSQTWCKMMGPIRKGDKFHIEANYDMEKNMPMKNARKKLSTVMGISIMYVAVKL